MSTTPTGWQAPKTNWAAADAVGPSDFNRIEQNINSIENGTRILEPTLPGASNAGTLRQILSWIVGRIGAITGAANWYDTPAITLEQAAGTDRPNSFVERQTFEVGIIDGADDTAVSQRRAAVIDTSRRYIEFVYNASGNPTTINERVGSLTGTIVKSTTLTWSGGDLTTITESGDGVSNPRRLNFDANGRLTSITPA